MSHFCAEVPPRKENVGSPLPDEYRNEFPTLLLHREQSCSKDIGPSFLPCLFRNGRGTGKPNKWQHRALLPAPPSTAREQREGHSSSHCPSLPRLHPGTHPRSHSASPDSEERNLRDWHHETTKPLKLSFSAPSPRPGQDSRSEKAQEPQWAPATRTSPARRGKWSCCCSAKLNFSFAFPSLCISICFILQYLLGGTGGFLNQAVKLLILRCHSWVDLTSSPAVQADLQLSHPPFLSQSILFPANFSPIPSPTQPRTSSPSSPLFITGRVFNSPGAKMDHHKFSIFTCNSFMSTQANQSIFQHRFPTNFCPLIGQKRNNPIPVPTCSSA